MDRLRIIYENPATTTKNKKILAARAGTKQAEAEKFLKSLAAVQVTQKALPSSKIHYVPTAGPTGLYLCDVIYLKDYAGVNKKRSAIFTVMNINTRYAYSRALTSPITSKKAADSLKSILTEINKEGKKQSWKKMKILRSDGGAENLGELQNVLKERGIEHEKLEARTHERLARLDRFHGSLRKLIGEVFARNNNNVWYTYLDDLMINYNTREHETLTKILKVGTSPSQVTESDESRLQIHDAKRKEEVRLKVPDYAPGTHVRLLMRRTSEGAKAQKMGTKLNDQTFTSKVYQILARAGPNSYEVNTTGNDAKIWPYHALQVVNMATTVPQPVAKKVNKKVVSAKRLEALNISEAEQKANMVSTRTRSSKVSTRSSKKAVDYRELAGLR
jgi:hypothetical protein